MAEYLRLVERAGSNKRKVDSRMCCVRRLSDHGAGGAVWVLAAENNRKRSRSRGWSSQGGQGGGWHHVGDTRRSGGGGTEGARESKGCCQQSLNHVLWVSMHVQDCCRFITPPLLINAPPHDITTQLCSRQRWRSTGCSPYRKCRPRPPWGPGCRRPRPFRPQCSRQAHHPP
jgi:hypothetical protein